MSGSGISGALCKSAPCSRQTTTPAPHHSVFYRLDALPATQPTASKHWRQTSYIHTHTHPFNGPMSGTTQVSQYQKSGFYWSKRQWVAVASAGPYASLHLAPDRQPRQHLTTQFFYRPDALPAAQPTVSKHWRQQQFFVSYIHSGIKTTTTTIWLHRPINTIHSLV